MPANYNLIAPEGLGDDFYIQRIRAIVKQISERGLGLPITEFSDLPTQGKAGDLRDIACYLADFAESGNVLLSDTANAREILAVQDRNGSTPLVARRLEAGSNVRCMILGDSILGGMMLGSNNGALRVLQNYIGNAGGGGSSINEAFWQANGSTAFITTDWYKTFARVPAASSVEWSGLGRIRKSADTAKVVFRAPVGGAATFKIQTCTDADGAGSGTWVDQGGVRTAAAVGSGDEEVRSLSVTLTLGSYRLRVLGVSGTVDVFGLELSKASVGGAVILNWGEDGTDLAAFAALTETQKSGLIASVDPDIVFVVYKDADIGGALTALKTTLDANLSGGYPRDLVLVAPFPTVSGNDPLTTAGLIIYNQRETMRQWAAENRILCIDLWDLGLYRDIYYLNDGIHLASTYEEAYLGWHIMRRLGWLEYRTVQNKRNWKAWVKTNAETTVPSATATHLNKFLTVVQNADFIWDAVASKTTVLPAGWYDFTLTFPADVTLWSLSVYDDGALSQIIGSSYGSRPNWAGAFIADGESVYDFRVEQFGGTDSTIYSAPEYAGLKIIRRS